MRPTWTIILAMIVLGANAQRDVSLKSGTITLPVFNASMSLDSLPAFNGQVYAFADFGKVLNKAEQQALSSSGYELLHATDDTYLIRCARDRSIRDLLPRPLHFGKFESNFKLSPLLETDIDHEAAVFVRVRYAPGLDESAVVAAISKAGGIVGESPFQSQNILNVAIPHASLNDLASIACILWIEPESEPDQLIRYQSAANERASFVIQSMGLSGEGVTIGIGDGGKVGSHLDLDGQLDNYAFGGVSTHATHVSGIAAGRPVLNPDQGYGTAPGADLVTSFYSTILSDAERHMQDHNMSVTNNSYGSSLGNCELMGDYNLTSIFIDGQLHQHDTLLHVFAAGNSGSMTCMPYTSGYATVLTGYQPSKNILCVGSCTKTDAISSFSSRGPVDDGRIKPDIVAVGSSVRSTRPNNIYQSGSGTSYSSPAIAGISALISEQYQSIYNTKPSAGLIKAALMNTADDLGARGPDYIWGYGRVNAKRAVELITDGHFVFDTLAQGDSMTIELNIPEQTRQLRIMLLWTDPPAAPFSTPALSNDLDLYAISGGLRVDPWILNPLPSYVAAAAMRGRDSINNQDQVTIDKPESGIHSFVIKGKNIPIGSQRFVVVWEYVKDGIAIVHPAPGIKFLPGRSERLRWDAYGQAVGPYSIDYALGNGEWQSIAQNYDETRRWINWTVPDTFTAHLRFRVRAGGYTDSISEGLMIVDRPSNLTATSPCANYASISWDNVDEASHYGIYRYNGYDMVFIDTAHSENFIAEGLLPGTEWYAVSSFLNDSIESLRTKAVSVTPIETTGCPWPKDLMISKQVNLTDGRKNTSSELTSSETLEVLIINIGTDTLSDIEVGYALNGGPDVNESAGMILAPGDSATHTFTSTLDLSASNEYLLTTWALVEGDNFNTNDSITTTIRQVDNPVVTLPWQEGFEPANEIVLNKSTFAFGGLDQWDYTQDSGPGRLRTYAGNEFIIDGEKAITLDGSGHNSAVTHKIIATINMSAYSAVSDDIRLSFDFMHHELEQDNDTQDIVAIRGSDTSTWIPVLDLYNLHKNPGEITSLNAGIPISSKLDSAGQGFSSSFQVSFSQEGSFPAGDVSWEDGYTFDNIELFEVGLDLELTDIIVPGESNCELTDVYPSVHVINTSDTSLGDLKISVAFQGDTLVNEVKVLPFADSVYTLLSPLDLSETNQSSISAWISHPDDDRNQNDSILDAVVLNFPFINTMPYFEDFEQGPGGWAVSGVNSSFELGSPANSKIRNAASGENAWVTGLISGYNTNEFSYLTSPCLNTSLLSEPYLSFAHIYELENNYDFFWVEYSTDGNLWTKLGEAGDGYKWYNDATTDTWDGINTQWHVASIPLPQADRMQVRFVMMSDVGLEYEGVGIDAIHVHEGLDIYSGLSVNPGSVAVSGGQWHDITSGDQVVVSIHPKGQDLGAVDADYYKFIGPVRDDGSAYFLDKNIVLSSSIPPVDTIGVRMYFNTSDFEDIETATGCTGCINPPDPFRILGRTFSGIQEDSIYENNTSGTTVLYTYPRITIIPAGEGYVAEFETDALSEFWLTSPVVKKADTIEVAVRSSSDDASEFVPSGGVNPNADSLQLNSPYSTGLRFTGINVPPGSFISSAEIKLTTWDQGSPGELVIAGHKSTDAEAFSTGNFNITGRSRTDRFAHWVTPPASSEDELTSPPLRTIVQEIIDMEDWQPGNPMAFILEGDGGLSVHAMESDPSMAAKLLITYDSVCTLTHRLYVDSAASGGTTGESWTNAFNDLQHALDLALRCPDIDEIWIARGTYLPSIDKPLCSFKVKPGLRIYGGFNGSETSLGERDPALNTTILSGNIGVPTHSSDNTYNVISIQGATDTAMIDGVTISHGFAYGPLESNRTGAGVYSVGNIILRDCFIENCTSLESGSAIFHSGADMALKLTNCTLQNNDAPFLRSEDGSKVIISNTNRFQINE